MNPDKAARFAEVARQMEREHAAARPIIDQLRGTIQTRLEQEIPVGWQTLGFASEATAAASAVLESDPKAARAFAQFALAILTRISADAYPEPLRRATESMSWKELANAHRYLSDYDAAHRALDAGERCLADSLTSAYDVAALQFARSLVYCDQRRFEEAERELASAVEIFEQHSDSRETAKCRLLQGMSAHRRGSLREACSLYEKAVESAGRSGDLATLASASNNLGHAKADLGEHAAAVEALQQALAVFSELGMRGETLRARCVLGCVLLAQARYSQAREMFLEARAGFRELGMTEECGISGLDLADALLGLGEHVRARMIIEDVISDLRQANLSERALTAVAYLREMVDTPQSREATRHVREYLQQLRTEPQRVFLPLPPH